MSIAHRVRNMVSRAVLRLVDDTTKMQSVQVETHADVVRDQAEHFQPYGFTSHPFPGAEGVALAVGGSTDHTVLIVVGDRRYRMTAMAAGEVAMHDDQGQSVHLTRAGIVVKGGGKPILFTDTPQVTIEAKLHVTGETTIDANTTVTGNVTATGNIVDLAGEGGSSMADIRQVYNGHTHDENENTVTLVPNQQLP